MVSSTGYTLSLSNLGSNSFSKPILESVEYWQVEIMKNPAASSGVSSTGNTRRLYQICKKFTRTYHIETASQLKNSWLKGKKTAGITAGASTPDWIVKEVTKKIEQN